VGYYEGRREPEAVVEVIDAEGNRRPLEARYAHYGFEWGYPGSGPRHLAAAILADRLGEQPLEEMITAFTEGFVDRGDREHFRIERRVVDDWLAAYERRPEYRPELERIVLGILLRSADARRSLVETEALVEDHFEEPRGRAILRAISALERAGAEVSLEAVSQAAGVDRELVRFLRDHLGQIHEFEFHLWAERLRAYGAGHDD
jgi:hypothetical protein